MSATAQQPTDLRDTLPEDTRPPAIDPAEAAERLERLEAAAREEMRILGHNHDWVPEPADGAYNVVVIGGGQAGLGAAFALSRHRIGRVKILEAGPEHPEAVGCWSRYARMQTLRSPKNMKGIEVDIPSLHTERWFRARYGDAAWESISLVPRLDWNDYLVWYRKVTDADVDFDTTVTVVEPPAEPGGDFTVRATRGGAEVTYRARRVVFSLGLDGGGGPFVPPVIADLPEDLRAHTEEYIDFPALAGKRVLVVGAGASGFDNAGMALENGAAEVLVVERESEVATRNSLRWMEFPGMQERFFSLPDDDKWAFGVFNGGLPQPPTQPSVWRAFAHDNFELRENTMVVSAEVVGEGADRHLRVGDNHGHTLDCDFIISATGYAVDLGMRPELARVVDDIRLWSDVREEAKTHPMGRCPYLGDGFQFLPKEGADEAARAYIPRLFHFSTGARASHGVAGNQLSGIYAGITRIADRVAADIMVENWPDFYADFQAFENIEVTNVGPHQPGEPWFPQAPRY